jgi:hypothetical protein
VPIARRTSLCSAQFATNGVCCREKFTVHEEHGRGLLVLIRGLGFAIRQSSREFHLRRSYANRPIDDSEVLVDDHFVEKEQLKLAVYFAVFSKVLFIPRSVH